jgi:spore maturation protein CgeB
VKIVILGLSITSSWGNGHATIFRGLVRELSARGHDVLFLERDQPWYAENRDMPHPPFGRTRLYRSVRELKADFENDVAEADCVLVGSYVPEGIEIGKWVTRAATGVAAFYDIDTPVTLVQIERGECKYLASELIPCYSVYLSFTGGPILEKIERDYGSPRAVAFYCSVDPAHYFPEPETAKRWNLGYLGTFSADRQPALDTLLLAPAAMWASGHFIVAGPQYPQSIQWPLNVQRVSHLSPDAHRDFYNAQRWTLNITRAEMLRWGWSPSVRLFEAAACGVPIISDDWEGVADFFEPRAEIIIAKNARDVLHILREMPDYEARAIGQRARERVLANHTAAHRAAKLEKIIWENAPTPARATNALAISQITT